MLQQQLWRLLVLQLWLLWLLRKPGRGVAEADRPQILSELRLLLLLLLWHLRVAISVAVMVGEYRCRLELLGRLLLLLVVLCRQLMLLLLLQLLLRLPIVRIRA